METLELYNFLHKHYKYEDGNLICIKKVRHSKYNLGDILGIKYDNDYTRTEIDGKRYLLHRLIFLFHHKYLPKFIDHIDRDKINNRIENLRPCDKSENKCNTNLRIDNKIGYKGIGKSRNKWYSTITKNGKRITTYHYTLEEAIEVRRQREIELFGEFNYNSSLI